MPSKVHNKYLLHEWMNGWTDEWLREWVTCLICCQSLGIKMEASSIHSVIWHIAGKTLALNRIRPLFFLYGHLKNLILNQLGEKLILRGRWWFKQTSLKLLQWRHPSNRGRVLLWKQEILNTYPVPASVLGTLEFHVLSAEDQIKGRELRLHSKCISEERMHCLRVVLDG